LRFFEGLCEKYALSDKNVQRMGHNIERDGRGWALDSEQSRAARRAETHRHPVYVLPLGDELPDGRNST
jgi:hypothetical protein